MNFVKTSLAILVVGLAPSLVCAAPLTDSQKAEVENVVRELLLNKEPNLIIKAAQEVQRRADKEDSAKGQEAIKKNIKKLTEDPASPVAGNKKGDVTIVEFFDYQCGYCKTVQKTVQEVLNADKNVRFVFKEYPILGQGSLIASQAALASVKQGKYLEFHAAMMESQERITQESVMDVARKVGLDIPKLEADMKDPKIEEALKENQKLGVEIGARGTPTFIIGTMLFPGALPTEQILEVIATVRKSGGK